MFNVEEHKDDLILVGGYKNSQKPWIFGEKPERDGYLYNIRFAKYGELKRPGSIRPVSIPDFILMYSYSAPNANPRLFRCTSYAKYSEEEMRMCGYINPHGDYIVYTLGEELDFNEKDIKKIIHSARKSNRAIKKDWPFILTGQDLYDIYYSSVLQKKPGKSTIRIVDLFAGLGGFHLAFKQLEEELKFHVKCEFVSELKSDLIALYMKNFAVSSEQINSDITKLDTPEKILQSVPEHDILCGGFPCQPFSQAGKQEGFGDKAGRGILFNYIRDIIQLRKPKIVFLENVANLETHDNCNTWKEIKSRLEEQGYLVTEQVLSPHEFGFPQHRKRIYIIAVNKDKGHLYNFEMPKGNADAQCSIENIIDPNPDYFEPMSDVEKKRLSVWQEFLDECSRHNATLPHPIWAMEFGATYPYEDKAPAYQPLSKLKKSKGEFGKPINASTIEQCLQALPNYAQTDKDICFPDWKIRFIRNNRKFYEENKDWLDPWKKQIEDWDNSFVKLEWNCSEADDMIIETKIVQFRPSGIRVKMPNYSPALTFVGSQVPLFPWVEYTKPDGTKGKGRYMTIKEAARVQGMQDLSFEGLSPSRIYEALGNAVDVEVIKIIARNILKQIYYGSRR